jgi:hypothetical protein
MLHEDVFDEVLLERDGRVTTLSGPIPYHQEGFAFTVFLEPNRRVVLTTDVDIHGRKDDAIHARGTVDGISSALEDGSEVIRVAASPDNHSIRSYSPSARN